MDPRMVLSDRLHDICEHVYYQPPASLRLEYPCIVYKLNNMFPWHANNDVYHMHNQYVVTVIDRNPDSELREQVARLRFSRWSRSFETENLHHWVFNVTV